MHRTLSALCSCDLPAKNDNLLISISDTDDDLQHLCSFQILLFLRVLLPTHQQLHYKLCTVSVGPFRTLSMRSDEVPYSDAGLLFQLSLDDFFCCATIRIQCKTQPTGMQPLTYHLIHFHFLNVSC